MFFHSVSCKFCFCLLISVLVFCSFVCFLFPNCCLNLFSFLFARFSLFVLFGLTFLLKFLHILVCQFFQVLAIDVTDRVPSDNPQGIPYKLIGEAAIPGISIISSEYIGSIFEEHRVVRSLSRFQFHSTELDCGTGVYGEQENKFTFFNSIVGRKSYARFKITNPNKVSSSMLLLM